MVNESAPRAADLGLNPACAMDLFPGLVILLTSKLDYVCHSGSLLNDGVMDSVC